MAGKANASAPAPAPKAAPPPAQPQGTHGPRTALAPSLVEMPKDAPNPVKDANARQKAALEKYTTQRDKAEVENAEVGGKPDPKAKTTEAGKSSPSKSSTAPDESTESTKEASPEKTAKPDAKSGESTSPKTEPAAEQRTREPRITLANFRKFAEENPEAAAEIGEHVFKVKGDLKGEFIRVQNKRRKLNEQAKLERDDLEAKMTAREAKAKELEEASTTTLKALSPIADLWSAVRGSTKKNADGSVDLKGLDFDAADAAFKENTGVGIDEYMRARARRGVVSPEMAKLRAENARLKREREKPVETTGEEVKPKELPAAKAEEKPKKTDDDAPKYDWGAEISGKHGLRKIAGWEKLLDAEMQRFHDPLTDEYDADPEQVADRLLKRELAALAGEEEPEKPKPAKAKPKIRPKTERQPESDGDEEEERPKGNRLPLVAKNARHKLPDYGDEDDQAEAPKGFKARERWALERWQKRMRGEPVED